MPLALKIILLMVLRGKESPKPSLIVLIPINKKTSHIEDTEVAMVGGILLKDKEKGRDLSRHLYASFFSVKRAKRSLKIRDSQKGSPVGYLP